MNHFIYNFLSRVTCYNNNYTLFSRWRSSFPLRTALKLNWLFTSRSMASVDQRILGVKSLFSTNVRVYFRFRLIHRVFFQFQSIFSSMVNWTQKIAIYPWGLLLQHYTTPSARRYYVSCRCHRFRNTYCFRYLHCTHWNENHNHSPNRTRVSKSIFT